MTFKRRQELFNVLFTSICSRLWKDRDLIWIEIPIERHQSVGKSIHSEFLIIQQRFIKDQFKAMPHLELIMQHFTPNSYLFNKDQIGKLIIYGENQEIIDAIFSEDRRLLEMLYKHHDKISAIHMTDQKLYNKFDLTLKIQLIINQGTRSDAMEGHGALIKDLLYMAD